MYGSNIGQLSVWKIDQNYNFVGNRLWNYPSKLSYISMPILEGTEIMQWKQMWIDLK